MAEGNTRGIKGYFDFSKGVITEGSKLTYEEGSLLDCLNMSYTPGSPLSKRLGMASASSQDEYGLVDVDFGPDAEVVGSWFWESPGGDPEIPVSIVGLGNSQTGGCWVHGLSVSGQVEQAFFVDLTDLITDDIGLSGSSLFGATTMAFSAIEDKLFVVCYGRGTGRRRSRVVSIRFPNIDDGEFSDADINIVDIRYRDFGDASSLSLTDELALYSTGDDPDWFGDPSQPQYGQRGAIIYDLFNRGWAHIDRTYRVSLMRSWDSNAEAYPRSSGRDPVPYFRGRLGRWPRKGNVWALGLTNYPELVNSVPRVNKVFDVDPYRSTNLNFGSAPTGHAILSAYNPQRWREMVRAMRRPDDLGYIDSTPDPREDRFTALAVWYGRVCYGTESGKVYMSQLYKDSQDEIAGKCYQEQDPTDPEFNDLLATDGTVVDIGGAGRVIGMVPLGEFLLVATNQGIWQIGGSAESYDIHNISVSKLLADPCTEQNSLVSFPGGVAFFADSSIYVVTRDPTVGTLSPESATDDRIKSLYIDEYSTGVSSAAFDYQNKRVEWLYPDGKILQFDVRTGAFYPQKIEGVEDSLVLAHKTPRLYIVPQEEDVVSFDPLSGDTEDVTSNGEQVTTTTSTIAEAPDTGLLYYKAVLSSNSLVLTRGSLTDQSLEDYGEHQYRAWAEAGYDTFSDPSSNKEIDTLFSWFEITEDGVEQVSGGYEWQNPGACDLSVKWEWTTSKTANRWYNVGNIYRLPVEYVVDDDDLSVDLSYTVANVATGIPGYGKSVVFRFDDQPGKHLRLHGWAVAAANEVNP